MGLFGSIGKFFGGVVKGVGKVAGIASAIAPIPGLGIVGKAATGLGGILAKGKRLQGQVERVRGAVMPGGAPVLRAVSGARAVARARGGGGYGGGGYQRDASSPTGWTAIHPITGERVKATVASAEERGEERAYRGTEAGAPARRRRRKKRASSRRSTRRSTRRRRAGGRRRLTRAQLRAGFGGKRRMRR